LLAGRAFAHGLATDAEIVAGAAQHHDLGAFAGAQQKLGQFDRHAVGGGVADLRPIERDFEHRSFAGGDNFVGHAYPSKRCCAKPVRGLDPGTDTFAAANAPTP